MFISLDNGKEQILVSVCEIVKIITRGKSVVVSLRDGTNEHLTFADTSKAYNFVSKIHEELDTLKLN